MLLARGEMLLARAQEPTRAETPPSYVSPVGEVLHVSLFGKTKEQIHVTHIAPERLPVDWKDSTGPSAEARHVISQLAKGINGWGGLSGGDNGLSGAKNLAEINAVFSNGWKEGADKARKLAADLGMEIPPAQSTRRRRVVGKDGTDPIIEAWIDRDIDHLWEKRKKFTAMGHKIIQIATGWGGNAGRSSAEMFWSGAAALVLTEQLESAGYGVEVHAYSLIGPGWSSAGGYSLLDCTVKPSDQMLAPDTFAAVLCHAGVWRAYRLAHLGHAPWDFGCGLGQALDIDRAAMGLVEAGVIPEIEILLPNIYNRESALECIRRGLEDIQEKYADKYGEAVE
jgi:hypothetical protein